MKFKPMVVLYGSVMQPLKEGQKAHYCQNGLWRLVLCQDLVQVKIRNFSLF